MEGWIKLHKKLTVWEWYSDINTTRLFIHCLLKANYSDKKWHGILIKKGSFITSLQKLSQQTGLGVQSVRTSLERLKSTGELTSKTTNKYTVVTIQSYKDYQTTNTLANKQLTNKQQTTNKQLTTTKKNKNKKEVIKKKKEYIYTAKINYLLSIPEEDQKTLLEKFPISVGEIKALGERLHDYCLSSGKTYKDYSAFLRNAVRREYAPKEVIVI